jgi:hypothetical protein
MYQYVIIAHVRPSFNQTNSPSNRTHPHPLHPNNFPTLQNTPPATPANTNASALLEKQPGGMGAPNFSQNGTRPSARNLPLRQPPLDVRLQHVKRNRSRFQHRIMKRPNAKSCTLLLLRFRPQLPNLQLPQLVSQRLTRPHDVPIDFDGNALISLPSVVLEKLNRLQPIECIPVSTTSRTARHISYVSWPNFEYGSFSSPNSSPRLSEYNAQPSTNAE